MNDAGRILIPMLICLVLFFVLYSGCDHIFTKQVELNREQQLLDMSIEELMEVPVVYHTDQTMQRLIDMPLEELMDVPVVSTVSKELRWIAKAFFPGRWYC